MIKFLVGDPRSAEGWNGNRVIGRIPKGIPYCWVGRKQTPPTGGRGGENEGGEKR